MITSTDQTTAKRRQPRITEEERRANTERRYAQYRTTGVWTPESKRCGVATSEAQGRYNRRLRRDKRLIKAAAELWLINHGLQPKLSARRLSVNRIPGDPSIRSLCAKGVNA